MINTVRIFVCSLVLFISLDSSAQIKEKSLDSLVTATLKAFNVPGIAVGITKDGKTIYSKGHGVRSLKNNLSVDDKTLFGIASNSKGFTCFALAILADEGKLNWDDKVRKYIPEFTMYNPFVTDEFNIRDLVTHRSGLGLGAGDLMFFPEGGPLTVQDIINNIRYLNPESSFRSKYQYNNNMFIVAGEVIHRVSGLSWEEFIEQRILQPVGMRTSTASYNRVKNNKNIIDAHAPVNGKIEAIPHDWNATANAAGGIMSNIEDMLTWAKFLMNEGVTISGKRLISKKQLKELWSLQMPISIGSNNPYDSNFSGYGLGWFVSDVKGHLQVTHTGGLIGTVTQFILIPDMDLGIVVLTNQQSGAAFNAISNTIKDSYLGYNNRNWLQELKTRTDRFTAYSDSIKTAVYNQVDRMKASTTTLPSKEQIAGTYRDKWFGDINIIYLNNEYRITCKNSPRLKGDLQPYNYNTYIAKWDDRSYDADAFVIFEYDEKGKAQSIKIKPISPITDFSFDFEHLNPERVR